MAVYVIEIRYPDKTVSREYRDKMTQTSRCLPYWRWMVATDHDRDGKPFLSAALLKDNVVLERTTAGAIPKCLPLDVLTAKQRHVLKRWDEERQAWEYQVLFWRPRGMRWHILRRAVFYNNGGRDSVTLWQEGWRYHRPLVEADKHHMRRPEEGGYRGYWTGEP